MLCGPRASRIGICRRFGTQFDRADALYDLLPQYDSQTVHELSDTSEMRPDGASLDRPSSPGPAQFFLWVSRVAIAVDISFPN